MKRAIAGMLCVVLAGCAGVEFHGGGLTDWDAPLISVTEDSATGKMLKSLGAETHQGTVAKGGKGCIEVIEAHRSTFTYRNKCGFGVIAGDWGYFTAYSTAILDKHTRWQECWDDKRPEWVLGSVRLSPFTCCYWNPVTKELADPETCDILRQ